MIVTGVATSGGPHPPEVHASFMLNETISIAPTATGQAVVDGTKLRELVYPIFVEACAVTQEAERANLESQEPTSDVFPASELVEDTISKIQTAAQGSMFENYFSQDAVKQQLRAVINHRLATAIDIERKWHADNLRVS